MPTKDKRRNQRFGLKLPLEVVRTGTQKLGKPGETTNLSSCGVLFTSNAKVEIGQPIEFLITLPTEAGGRSVRLRCVGKVVRLEESEADTGHAVAATMERFEFVRV
ncbi:MAG TPA: PilZ domain-containing protein [Bryobacteraceae bacterium]|nr:PilZ domain-containing protein [Bryobacteraceae bacterium]